MPEHTLRINDADSKASQVLGRMRVDGLDEATVPFDERFVCAWQRRLPEPDMSVNTLTSVLAVRCFALWRLVSWQGRIHAQV